MKNNLDSCPKNTCFLSKYKVNSNNHLFYFNFRALGFVTYCHGDIWVNIAMLGKKEEGEYTWDVKKRKNTCDGECGVKISNEFLISLVCMTIEMKWRRKMKKKVKIFFIFESWHSRWKLLLDSRFEWQLNIQIYLPKIYFFYVKN